MNRTTTRHHVLSLIGLSKRPDHGAVAGIEIARAHGFAVDLQIVACLHHFDGGSAATWANIRVMERDPGVRKLDFTGPLDAALRGLAFPRTLEFLDRGIAQTIAVKGGGGTDRGYPKSLMGAMALTRQTLHDARWYRDAPVVETRQRPDGTWDVVTPKGTVHAGHGRNALEQAE